MLLLSPAFADGSAIPARFTGEGPDLSPALRWTGPPEGTRAYGLILEDPDAPMGTWVHWVVYDLPASAMDLGEGQPRTETLPQGGHQGRNSWSRMGYNGPAPPPGKVHRYYFRLYALSTPLALLPGASRAEVDQAMKGRILAQAQIMGTFRR